MVDQLMCVWPVLDPSRTTQDLIAEATEQLPDLAAAEGAYTLGRTRWERVPTDGLDGWEWLNGELLIAFTPARPVIEDQKGDAA